MIDHNEQLAFAFEPVSPANAAAENDEVAQLALAALCEPEELVEIDVLPNADNLKLHLMGAVAEAATVRNMTPQHIQAALLFTQGYNMKEIAATLGMEYATVKYTLKKPAIQALLVKYMSAQAAVLPDITDRLKFHAHEALDKVVHIMRTGRDEVASKAGFKLLEMAGYGAVKKVEASHNVSLGGDKTGELLSTLKQSMEMRKTGYSKFIESSSSEAEIVDVEPVDLVELEARSA